MRNFWNTKRERGYKQGRKDTATVTIFPHPEPLQVQNSKVLPEIQTSATSLDPPLHNHAVLQTGRLDRQTVVFKRAIWESCPDSIRSHIVFWTRTRVE
jgi:hypothetical protein